MINEENVRKMYDKLIENVELTTKELNECGFNSKDLADLIDKGIIERVKRGHYIFTSVANLFNYANKLFANQEYDKANLCLEKCYELDPNNIQICFSLFLSSVKKEDYNKCFEYFEKIYNTDSEYHNADTNLYIYLLSIITDIPEKHRLYAKYMRFEDVAVSTSDSEHALKNKVRTAILNHNFAYALKLMNDLKAYKNGKNTIQDLTTKVLLRQTINVQRQNQQQILELAKNQNYQEIINFIRNKMLMCDLSLVEKLELTLCNDILDILKKKSIPKATIFETNKLSDAIEGYNYELALKLCNNYNEKNRINNNDNVIDILLRQINDMISNIIENREKEAIVKTENYEKTAELLEESNFEIIDVLNDEFCEEVDVFIETNDLTNNFTNVIRYLMNQDLDNAFKVLHNYLISLNKDQYEFLIIDLIKISLIENDLAFTKPMIALTYISRENFVFDISEYIQDFYQTLAENKFNESRIYLDIIAKSEKIGKKCVLTNNLEQVLNNREKCLNYESDNIISDKVNTALKSSDNNTQALDAGEISKVVEDEDNTEVLVDNKIINDSVKKDCSLDELVISKRLELQ